MGQSQSHIPTLEEVKTLINRPFCLVDNIPGLPCGETGTKRRPMISMNHSNEVIEYLVNKASIRLDISHIDDAAEIFRIICKVFKYRLVVRFFNELYFSQFTMAIALGQLYSSKLHNLESFGYVTIAAKQKFYSGFYAVLARAQKFREVRISPRGIMDASGEMHYFGHVLDDILLREPSKKKDPGFFLDMVNGVFAALNSDYESEFQFDQTCQDLAVMKFRLSNKVFMQRSFWIRRLYMRTVARAVSLCIEMVFFSFKYGIPEPCIINILRYANPLAAEMYSLRGSGKKGVYESCLKFVTDIKNGR